MNDLSQRMAIQKKKLEDLQNLIKLPEYSE